MSLLTRTGNLGRTDPARGASATGFRLWLARSVAITCLVSLLPALFVALGQIPFLHPGWLGVIGGGVVGFSLLMPVYAWSQGDIRWLCGAYALVVLVGLATWTGAWTGPTLQGPPPWLWVCVGVAGVCAAMATTVVIAFGYTAATALTFGAVRMTKSGGDLDALFAMQDVLNLLVLPTALLLLIQFFDRAVNELDATTARG